MIRVLQFSTHNEDCGIAKYQERFVRAFRESEGVETDYFEYSPNKTKLMNPDEFRKVLEKFSAKLQGFDILHIQHELSFFYSSELEQIIRKSKSLGKKVIVTVHTAPDAQLVTPNLGGFGLHSVIHFIKQKISMQRFLDKYVNPLKNVDRIIVHNESTRQNLIKYGVNPQKVTVIRHPVPSISHNLESDRIRKALGYKKGDVIFAAVGFLSAAKGTVHAVKALSYLPDNYKLAIIGGVHPDAQDTTFLDEVTDCVNSLNIRDRVYITGYVPDDNELDALVSEVDMCVYPFDKKYYSFVSSGSLNIALSSHKPVIAYHTPSFDETNTELDVVAFCKSPNYYELARSIKDLDIPEYTENVKKYAELYDWDKEANRFIGFYHNLINS